MTGFINPSIWGQGFKPVNASTIEKIQHRDIQVKFTCGVLKKKTTVGFWTGSWTGFKNPQVNPMGFLVNAAYFD